MTEKEIQELRKWEKSLLKQWKVFDKEANAAWSKACVIRALEAKD